MKFIEPRPFADPEAAARKLVELANAFEPIQDGRIYIEKISVSRAADIPTGWEITLDLVRRVAALDGH